MFDDGWEDGASGPAPTWSRATPGPDLAVALASCEARDVAEDGGFDAAERLGGWEALAAWAAGCQAREAADYLDARRSRAHQCPRDVEQERQAVAMELATYARVAPMTGEHRLHQAHTLRHRLPRTLAALLAGRIAYSHARVVIDQTQDCTEETARAVDTAVWDLPEKERTPTQLRETVRRVVARLDPESLRRKTVKARLDRTVRYWADDDGATGVIQVRMPADEARGVFAVIDALAHTAADPTPENSNPPTESSPTENSPTEQRTLGNKRADVVRDLVLGALDTPVTGCPCTGTCTSTSTAAAGDTPTDDTPTDEPLADDGPIVVGEPDHDAHTQPQPQPQQSRSGSPAAGPCSCSGSYSYSYSGSGYRDPGTLRVQVRVTIPWRTLAGLSEDPADLEGHGPLPADQARALAGLAPGLAPGTGTGTGTDVTWQATWQRLLTDPVTGTARHLDTTRYRPPAALAELVRTRDRTCTAPGCRMPAARCDLDHVIPYDHTTDRESNDGDDGGKSGGGRTDEHNLRPDCRRHHRIKTHTDWTCHIVPDPLGGPTPVVQWTSPTGRTWIVRAPELDDPWHDRTDNLHNPEGPADPGPDLPTPATAHPGIGLAA